MITSNETSAAGGGGRGVERFRFEPTVFGAVRRYPLLVVLVALITAAVAVGYTLVIPELYRARAGVTVPLPGSLEGANADQYLDSQVLLLQSAEVAEGAERIADTRLGGDVLGVGDFLGDDKSLEIIPPEGANPGSFGANTIAVAFTWPDATVAQAGVNALLQAFDDVRAAAIRAEADATVAGIDRAIADPRTQGQVADLVNQRTQALVALQVDLARRPTVAWAVEPQVAINANSRNAGVIGLVLGVVLGAALAYGRAVRRRRFDDRLDPAALYAVPLIGEIPAFTIDQSRPNGSGPVGVLPVAGGRDRVIGEAFRFTAGALERIRTARRPGQALAFVSARRSPSRSAVVADLALALAAGGTRVLVVDADAGELTMLLLPDDGSADGFAQVLAGQCGAVECIRRSPWNTEVAVLGSSPVPARPVTGAAYANSMRRLLAEVGESYDVVLVDSPPLLQVAEATELVGASDEVVVVVGAQDLVRDHDQLVDRLELIGSEVIGYVFDRAGSRSWFGGTGSRPVGTGERRGAPAAPPADLPGVPLSPVLEDAAQSNGDARPSSAPQPRQ